MHSLERMEKDLTAVLWWRINEHCKCNLNIWCFFITASQVIYFQIGKIELLPDFLSLKGSSCDTLGRTGLWQIVIIFMPMVVNVSHARSKEWWHENTWLIHSEDCTEGFPFPQWYLSVLFISQCYLSIF